MSKSQIYLGMYALLATTLTTFTEKSVKAIVEKETSTEYEDVMKYAPYTEKEGFPTLSPIETRLGGVFTEFETKEFSTMCKLMNMPDYVEYLKIRVIPNEHTVEMKTLRDYLIAFRDMDIYQEEVTGVIAIDLIRCIKPAYLEVEICFTPRGGMKTTAKATYADDATLHKIAMML